MYLRTRIAPIEMAHGVIIGNGSSSAQSDSRIHRVVPCREQFVDVGSIFFPATSPEAFTGRCAYGKNYRRGIPTECCAGHAHASAKNRARSFARRLRSRPVPSRILLHAVSALYLHSIGLKVEILGASAILVGEKRVTLPLRDSFPAEKAVPGACR